MYINKCKIKVRYAETDKMGVVHHSRYYPWFEVGRGEFISQCGITYKEIEDEGIMLPLVESGCKYIHGAKYDEELVIETYIKALNGAKIVFNYNVVRECDGEVLAKGTTTHVFVNNDFKIINIKRKHLEIWEKLNDLYKN